MPIDLDLTADLNAAWRHAPSAVASALTAVAFDARDAVREELPKRFTIRRPWVAKGIGVERANTATLVAHVFSRDAFMALQEQGGTKTGKMSVPAGRMARMHETTAIPRGQWPKRMLARKNVFHRAGTIFERRGRTIQALYLLRRSVKVAPRFGMSETVRSVVLKWFEWRLGDALLNSRPC